LNKIELIVEQGAASFHIRRRRLMPVHVEEMTSEVAVMDGDLPLSERQVEKLIQIILRRLEEKKREAESSREATTLRRSARPWIHIGE
jgi:hypothetical protein